MRIRWWMGGRGIWRGLMGCCFDEGGGIGRCFIPWIMFSTGVTGVLLYRAVEIMSLSDAHLAVLTSNTLSYALLKCSSRV